MKWDEDVGKSKFSWKIIQRWRISIAKLSCSLLTDANEGIKYVPISIPSSILISSPHFSGMSRNWLPKCFIILLIFGWPEIGYPALFQTNPEIIPLWGLLPVPWISWLQTQNHWRVTVPICCWASHIFTMTIIEYLIAQIFYDQIPILDLPWPIIEYLWLKMNFPKVFFRILGHRGIHQLMNMGLPKAMTHGHAAGQKGADPKKRLEMGEVDESGYIITSSLRAHWKS